MGEIEIIKRDGTRIPAHSKEPFCTPTQAVQNTALMSDDTVTLSLTTTECYSFGKGDRVEIDGVEYKIRTAVQRMLQTDRYFKYDITFYGPMYDLMKCQYRNTGADGKSTKAVFDLTYTLREFGQVIIFNMNRDYPGKWAFDADNCPDTEPLTLSFSRQNCLQVLQSLCSDSNFKTEFRITQANGVCTIHIGKFGQRIVPPSGADYFEWGKGNGLYTLTEKKVNDKAIITRLWVEGGTTNVRSGYRDWSDRIQLPYPKRLNRNRHVLRDGTVIEAGTQMIGIDDDEKRYFEDEELRDALGSEEDSKVYEECYPKRTGKVTALGNDVYEFIDDTMDFDLNAKDDDGNTLYLIPGNSAKITFLTGLLAGTEFELSGYDTSTKKFRVIKYTDERGLSVPTEDTEAFRISVGDTYKITDIVFPESYDQDAEENLWYEGLQDFNDAKQARVQYELKLERSYFLDNMPSDSETSLFHVGDYVPVKDTRFGIEKNIRITKVQRNLLARHDYTLTLSDTTAITVSVQAVLDVIDHDKIIEVNHLRDLARAKRGWRTTEELRTMVYDTDGYFDTDNIRPNSIDTNMLTVGSKSQQFILDGVVLAANYGGKPNQFSASAGTLHHLSLSEDNIVSWNMTAAQVTLTESGGYYLFAKCPKNGTTGTWYVTQEQLKVEPTSDPNNYYFQVGVIGPLVEGGTFRDFATTYGFTRINGGTITTGKIASSHGAAYIDLDNEVVNFGNLLYYLVENNVGKLALDGSTLIQTGSGAMSRMSVWCGQYDPDRYYRKGEEVWYRSDGVTCTYTYISDTRDKGHAPTDTSYWEVSAEGAKGAGVFKSMVFRRSDTRPDTPTGGGYASPVPSGWSDGVPSGDGLLWVSTRVFTSDGASPQETAWTTPEMPVSGDTMDYRWSGSSSRPADPGSDDGSDLAWTAATDVSWIKLTKASGSGSDTVGYTVSANTGSSARTGHVTIKDSGGNTRTLTVTQSGTGSSGGSISPTSASIGASGGSQTLTVTDSSSAGWTISKPSSATWLSLSRESGTGSGTVTLTAAVNSGTSSRTATLSFACGNTAISVTVTQAAASASSDATISWPSSISSGEVTVQFTISDPNSHGWLLGWSGWYSWGIFVKSVAKVSGNVSRASLDGAYGTGDAVVAVTFTAGSSEMSSGYLTDQTTDKTTDMTITRS